MSIEINKDKELSGEQVAFLLELGFSKDRIAEEDVEDPEDLEDDTWDSYSLTIAEHPLIEDLYITVNVKPGFIQAFGRGAHSAFIEKPFTRENLLPILNFLGYPIPNQK